MIDIQDQFWKLVKLRYHWFFSHSSLGSSAISWTFMGLSNKDIEMIEGQTSSSINILNNYGMMYTPQRENQWTTFLPCLYISLTESTYEVPRHFNKEFWKRMCDPAETFTKKDFQTLSFMRHTMHTDAFLKSGIYYVPLALLFAGTTCKNVMDVSVKLHNVGLCNLQRSWPGTTTWPALQGQICSEGKGMVGYLFSNAEGSVVDAIELFEVEKPKSNYKFVMIAYKIKFGQAKLTANEIIEDWKNITGALKKSNDSQYISFMKKVRIVLFMCTNQSLEDNIHEQVTDIWDGGKRNTPRYIITDNIETYLGPFKNIIQSFDKSS